MEERLESGLNLTKYLCYQPLLLEALPPFEAINLVGYCAYTLVQFSYFVLQFAIRLSLAAQSVTRANVRQFRFGAGN